MHGVFANQDIKQGDLLLTWNGVLLSEETIDAEGVENYFDVTQYGFIFERNKVSYMFCPRLKFDGKPRLPSEASGPDRCMAVFMNEPDPNFRAFYDHSNETVSLLDRGRYTTNVCVELFAQNKVVWGPVLYASRNIKKGEELVWNYDGTTRDADFTGVGYLRNKMDFDYNTNTLTVGDRYVAGEPAKCSMKHVPDLRNDMPQVWQGPLKNVFLIPQSGSVEEERQCKQRTEMYWKFLNGLLVSDEGEPRKRQKVTQPASSSSASAATESSSSTASSSRTPAVATESSSSTASSSSAPRSPAAAGSSASVRAIYHAVATLSSQSLLGIYWIVVAALLEKDDVANYLLGKACMQRYLGHTHTPNINKMWEEITRTPKAEFLNQTIQYMQTLFDDFQPQTRFKMATYWFSNMNSSSSSLVNDVNITAQQVRIDIDQSPPSLLFGFNAEERTGLTNFKYMYFVTCAACQDDPDPWACLRLSKIHFNSDNFSIEPDENAGVFWLKRCRNEMRRKAQDERRSWLRGLTMSDQRFLFTRLRALRSDQLAS